MKVLLIEDERDVAEVFEDWLKNIGYEIHYCSNGYTAGVEILDHSSDGHFDLVITDIKLPGKSGSDLIDLLERLEPMGGNLPIIFLSGFIDEELREKYKEISRIFFIDKPVSRDNFMAVVEETKKFSSKKT